MQIWTLIPVLNIWSHQAEHSGQWKRWLSSAEPIAGFKTSEAFEGNVSDGW